MPRIGPCSEVDSYIVLQDGPPIRSLEAPWDNPIPAAAPH